MLTFDMNMMTMTSTLMSLKEKGVNVLQNKTKMCSACLKNIQASKKLLFGQGIHYPGHNQEGPFGRGVASQLYFNFLQS